MSNTEFIGYLAVYGVTVLGGIVALVKPIINLNVNIQKLTDSITQLTTDSNNIKADVEQHEKTLQDHETRLTVIEKDRDK